MAQQTWSARELVLEPSLSTDLVCSAAGDCRGRRVLVVGSGAGVIPVACARAGGAVTAIDVNPLAVAATRSYAETCGVGLDVRCQDFWSMQAVEASWDRIVANPPQQPSEALPQGDDWFGYAHLGGVDGLEFVTGLLRYAAATLSPGGDLVCSVFGFLRDERWQDCARAEGLCWSLAMSGRKVRGAVTTEQMQRLPASYRAAALSEPDYEVRVFRFVRR